MSNEQKRVETNQNRQEEGEIPTMTKETNGEPATAIAFGFLSGPMLPNQIQTDSLVPVFLPNFSVGECDCSDGCGKKTDPMLLLRVQAFLFILTGARGRKIRAIVKGGARCEAKQRAVYSDPALVPAKELIRSPEDPTPTSMHMGVTRVDHGTAFPGAALDLQIQEQAQDGSWQRIPNAIVLKYARLSGLFTGIGSYSWGVHFDCRAGFAMWSR